MIKKRNFLFLQGVCSPFFSKLADHLSEQGHRIYKVNFTTGDKVYWYPRAAVNFRAEFNELPDFMAKIWSDYDITDQILFGDKRPIHNFREFCIRQHQEKTSVTESISKQNAHQPEMRTHVFEEGYFRPYWVTLEREGVNNHSLLPKDPDWYRKIGKKLPRKASPKQFNSSFRIRAFHDVVYNVSGLLNPIFFPKYKRHVAVAVYEEYASYVRKFIRSPIYKRRDNRLIQAIINTKARYYLLPLQLSNDAQIVHHSKYESMVEFIEEVMISFAQFAPTDAKLVIKNHPLDIGLVNYQAHIDRLEQTYNLAGRIVYLESGNLDMLLKGCLGVVTINSTVGGVALEFKCPTIALADPIYNFPGLTFQGRLDDFWQKYEKPDADLFSAFKKTVIFATQINGGFYCKSGIELAVANAGQSLTAEISPLEQLL